MEIFEGEVAVVAGFFEGVGDGRPVGGAIEERAEGFEGVVCAFFGEFLEVDVFDAVAELADPVFGKLEEHDVASVEVDFDVVTFKAVHKFDHLSRCHEVPVEEDVFDVQVDAKLFSFGEKFADGVTGTFVAKVVGSRVMICPPRHVYGTGYDEEVFSAKVMGSLSHESGKFETSCPFFRIITGERIRPEEKRAEATDLDADFVCHFSDVGELLGTAFRGEVAFQIVVQFNSIKACIFREL